MTDYKACLNLIKEITMASHTKAIKEAIKPSLNNKEAMTAYAKATGNTGKAVFN